jgi:serine/threonine protein kinase
LIGTKLSHFKLTAKLGEGGMGEVYRAEDTKLGRDVAIKVLPEAVARDPERLARFEREAKVLASLNHPNIAAIYSIESPVAGSDGAKDGDGDGAGRDPTKFLVMELVEGEDLSQRLDRGPIDLAEALPIALQIARALEAAHESGIVHRDLKPANVKVTSSGQVKVLDFGLAKALDAAPTADDDASMSPTLTAHMTQVGVLLGTAAYMSPEQAAGEAADRRADIWAFGVVLAEMLSGRQQFSGKTVSHVLAAILKDEPDWQQLPADTPPAIVDLLRRCLRKEPTHRLQAIGEARILIEDYLDHPEAFERADAARVTTSPAGWKQTLPWVLLGLMLVAVVGGKWLKPGEETSSSRVLKATILPPEDSAFYLSGWNPGPVAVSPDGTKLAYSVQEESGAVRLYVRELDSTEARALPETESAAYPFWAPDSRWLAFFTDVDQTMKKIDTAGGPPVTICDASNGKGGSWNQDGVIIFAPRANTQIFRVSASGGEPTPITEIDLSISNSHRHPRFLPDGDHFLYLARGIVGQESRLRIGSLADVTDKEIIHTSTQGEFAAGFLLFTRGTTLMAQRFDPERLEFSGEATPLLEEILTVTGAALGVFSSSSCGTLAFNSGDLSQEVPLEWRDRKGNPLGTVGEPAQFGAIALSPDGKMVASVIFNSSGIESTWLTEIATGLRTRLTFDDTSNYGLAWAPDSGSLFLSSLGESGFEVRRASVGGVGEMEELLSAADDLMLSGVSPDGKTLILWQTRAGTGRDLLIWNLDQGGKPSFLRETDADERFGVFSPDGKWIAYSSNDSGRYEVYLTPFPGPGRRWQLSQHGGMFPQWSADGREVVFTQRNGMLMAAGVAKGAETIQAGAIETLFQLHPPRPDGTSFALAPDGERILVWSNKQQQAETVVNLVVNWPAELSVD